MRTFSIFMLCAFVSLNGLAQSNCGVADSYLVYAYSNIKDAYESNNKDHLKYYSNKSLESFEKAKPILKSCGCETAYNLIFDSIELLKKVETATTFEDGRFFVKRVKAHAKNSIIALDSCNSGAINTSEETNNDLASIEDEQQQLEAQHKALQQKAEDIQKKLEAKNLKAIQLQKELLIKDYKLASELNVKNYNETLKICNWKNDLIKISDTESNLMEKSMDEIKTQYLNALKAIATDYLSKLNLCGVN